jgi:transposase
LGFGIVAVGRRKEVLFMAKDIVKEIRRATRRKFNAEEKIRIVLEGLRGEVPVSDLCRREGVAPTLYYRFV